MPASRPISVEATSLLPGIRSKDEEVESKISKILAVYNVVSTVEPPASHITKSTPRYSQKICPLVIKFIFSIPSTDLQAACDVAMKHHKMDRSFSLGEHVYGCRCIALSREATFHSRSTKERLFMAGPAIGVGNHKFNLLLH
jgi:hypothetical protein